ncbi:putative UDP-galactose 4-epimerase [Teratosphaeria destructans]|uniref:UDP-galactose 4-epimerase n=1 Tax=Teratosphaeria destructans TaxID=418781 RepID=A0A9W7T2C6_9PEZI|nr:putative UDP-galactose 4-epimerase [Teratosphaeria destructans]
MKIAITGARGTVGKEVVKLCAEKGHHTIQIDHTENTEKDETPNTEHRTADAAADYDALLDAFKGADAIIHLAAIPDPVDKADHVVHSNNVNAAFNGFHAAGDLGIKKICYASSVNAIGLAYANQPLTHFDYFPLDEESRANPTDAYAVAKNEAELQARCFANWFPGTTIALLRIHEVAPRREVAQEHAENWDEAGVKQLWGWVHPRATARACLLAVERSERFEGAQVFNVCAPTTAQETSSRELARKYYPGTEVRGEWGKGNDSFWTIGKAERVLGWRHEEVE